MKRNLLVASLGAVALGTMFSMSASAQTCASPFAWQPPPAGETIGGTTCGQESNNGGGFCGGNFGAPGPAYVIQSTFAAGRTATTIDITNNVGFGGAVYVTPVASGCGVNANCVATGSPGSPVALSFVPNGDFFVIVTGVDFDANGACGTFNLTADGTFPVTLQDFSVI